MSGIHGFYSMLPAPDIQSLHARPHWLIDGHRGSLLCKFAKKTHDAHHVNLYSLENYRVSLICSVLLKI
jgi:hypothetical protein